MASSHVAWRRWYRSISTAVSLAVRFPRVVTDLYHRQFGRFGVLFSAAGLVAGVVLSGPGLVAPVGFCRGQVQVGDERVVSPVGPQLGLGTEQAGAAHYQANPAFLRPFLGVGHLQDCFPHLCQPAFGIGNGGPRVFVDIADQCPNLGIHLGR